MLALLALLGAAALAWRDPGRAAERSDVVRVAERFALALSQYDYRHLDGDVARVHSLGVGYFRFQYDHVLAGSAFRDALRTNQAVATAKVVTGPMVAELGTDQARTFTVLEQSVVNKDAPNAQRRRVRVETILVKTTRGWRADWVEIT